jgi:hypothetical protein
MRENHALKRPKDDDFRGIWHGTGDAKPNAWPALSAFVAEEIEGDHLERGPIR